MFCDEPVQAIWYMENLKDYGADKQWAHYMCNFEIGLYLTDGYWLVLQTESHQITLGADGVHVYNCQDDLLGTERAEACNYTRGDFLPETLALTGERIRNVEKAADGWVVTLEHLVIPIHKCEGDMREHDWLDYSEYVPYLGVSHKLKRCRCGGNPELMLDFVADYIIRCDRCRCSTYADYGLERVVKDWNRGKHPCKGIDTPMEHFLSLKGKPIDAILFSKRVKALSNELRNCDEMLVRIKGDYYYRLERVKTPGSRYELTIIHEASGINPDMWPYAMAIDPDERLSLAEYDSHNGRMLFASEKRQFEVTAEADGVCVRFSSDYRVSLTGEEITCNR